MLYRKVACSANALFYIITNMTQYSGVPPLISLTGKVVLGFEVNNFA